MMDRFIECITEIADVLRPFSTESAPGVRRWDGERYAPWNGGPIDVAAGKWWGILTALAEMLVLQVTPVTADQRDYFNRLLFGGMGSLNDFALDEQRLGSPAIQANAALRRLRMQLYDAFQGI